MGLEYRYPLTNDLVTMIRLFCGRPSEVLRRERGIVLDDYRILEAVKSDAAVTAGRLSEVLDMAPALISRRIAKLTSRDCLLRGAAKGAGRRVLSLSEEGLQLCEAAFSSIEALQQQLISALTPQQRDSFDVGCLATATVARGLLYRDGGPDRVHMYLLAVLLAERSLKKNAQRFDVGLGEARVLFALLQEDGLTSTELSRLLLMPKSTVSDVLGALAGKGSLDLRRIDGRSFACVLTAEGRALARACSYAMDDGLVNEGDIRVPERTERVRLVSLARTIVAAERQRFCSCRGNR